MNEKLLSPVLTRHALRFALAGGLVTGLHVLIATILIQAAMLAPSFSNGMAFVVATVFSYFINTMWSFSSPLYRRNLYRFFTVSLIGLFLAMAISGVAQYCGLHYGYGIVFVTCTVPLVTFLFHNFWTYR
ncbi:MAG: GtrA family protein [Oleispira sp.]|nr:GtrA family protein [Oleispira sp.]